MKELDNNILNDSYIENRNYMLGEVLGNLAMELIDDVLIRVYSNSPKLILNILKSLSVIGVRHFIIDSSIKNHKFVDLKSNSNERNIRDIISDISPFETNLNLFYSNDLECNHVLNHKSRRIAIVIYLDPSQNCNYSQIDYNLYESIVICRINKQYTDFKVLVTKPTFC